MKYFLTLISILIAISSSSLAYEKVDELLRETLIRHYNCDDVKIENIRYSETINSIPLEIKIEETSHGLTLFNIKLPDGKIIKASAKISLLGRVIVSKRPLRKGSILTEGDLDLRLVDLKRIPPGAFRRSDEITGRIINRSLSHGVIITDDMLAKGDSIKRGKRILIVAESPYFRISVPGELRENTVVGGYARAINLQTKKTVSGILIDEDTMRVEF
ncbi:MAG: flagellar basal body P-ring formation chaperone FlgA [Thermodesulfovibrionales bacterium]